MSSGSIQIKRKDRNDGAGSTFDGIKFTFSPSIKVTQLTGLRVKRTRAAADDPGALSQNIFNDPSKFVFNGSSITLQIGRQEFIAVDFIREVSEEEFQAAATPEMIQFRNVLLGGIGSDLKGAAENEKMKNLCFTVLCFILITIGSNAYADDRRFITNDHIVVDLERQIEWLRCSVGQQWNGQTCIGNIVNLSLVFLDSLSIHFGKASDSNLAPCDPPSTNKVIGHGPGSKYWELDFLSTLFLIGLPVFKHIFESRNKVFEKWQKTFVLNL